MQVLETQSSCGSCPYKSLVFGSLTNTELEQINTTRKEVLYKKGEVVTQEGDKIKEFLYLKSGLVKVFKTGLGRKDQIIRIARSSDFVSLLSMFSNDTYKYSMTALEDTTVCIMDSDQIKLLVEKNGKFAVEILNRISNTYDKIIESTFKIRQKHLRGRIAYILLYFANKVYQQNKFELPVSRREIAELINMTTENVIRILSEFRKDGIILIDGKVIEILNIEFLEKLSKSG